MTLSLSLSFGQIEKSSERQTATARVCVCMVRSHGRRQILLLPICIFGVSTFTRVLNINYFFNHKY